jgi:DNA-binding NtrC family response regulator
MKPNDSKRPASILLVDDDQHLLQSMGAWLGDQGYAVQLSADNASARKQLESQSFDLALVDLRLGPDDGMELLRHCRKHFPNVVVVLMTGHPRGCIRFAHQAID